MTLCKRAAIAALFAFILFPSGAFAGEYGGGFMLPKTTAPSQADKVAQAQSCVWKRIKVWDADYGRYVWKRVRVCQ